MRAAISPSLSARSHRETYFRKDSRHLNGPNFFLVNRLLDIQDAVFRDVRCDFLRFRQRTDPLIIIELFRGWVLLLLQEDELRVEEESAFFRQIASRPHNSKTCQVLETDASSAQIL